LAGLTVSGNVYNGDRLKAGNQVIDLTVSGSGTTTVNAVEFTYTVTSTGSTARVLFKLATGEATVTAYEALLDNLAFTHLSDSPNTTARVLSISVNDGELDSNVATATISVTATNDTPTISDLTTLAEYDWGRDIPTRLFPLVQLGDLDGTVQSMTLKVTGGRAGDQLNFATEGTVTGVWNVTNQTLTLSNTGDTAAMQAALRTVTFSSSLDTNRTVFVDTTATDNNGLTTLTATTQVKLHSVRPSIDLQEASDTGTSNTDNVTSDNTPTFDVGVPSDAVVNDVLKLFAADGTTELATVTLTQAHIDAASVAMTTSTLSNGAQTIIAKLVLTGATAELAILVDTVNPIFSAQSFDYLEGQSASAVIATLRATDSANTSDTSGVTSFTITAGNDSGYFAVDNQGRITITAAGVAADVASNDYETGSNTFALTVRAEDAAGNFQSQTITLNVLNSDEANPTISDQSYNYAEGKTLNDVLATVSASDDIAVTGFAFKHTVNGVHSYHSTSQDGFYTIDNSGQIRLTVAGISAAVNDFETTPNSFTYTVQAKDAANHVSEALVTLGVTNVNDAPAVIRAADHSVNYEEGGPAVAVAPGISVGDQDNTTLASAVVSIGSGYISGSDALGFVNSGAAVMGNITGSYNNATGVLTLSSVSATATLAQWQNALRAVFFSTSSTEPGDARTISWKVNDGSATAPTNRDSATVVTSIVIKNNYTEQEAAFSPINVANFTNTTGGNVDLTDKSFATNGTLTFAITAPTTSETLALSSVLTAGTANGTVSVVGSNVYLGDGSSATLIATVSGGTSGNNLVVAANADFPADHTVMEKIAQLVTYHNSSDLTAANATQTRTLTVTAIVNAGTPATSAFTQSIQLIEVNDAVSLTAPTAIGYTDTSANDAFSATTAALSATDPDASTTFIYGLTGGTLSGSSITRVGTYGTLSVHTSTGAYTYTPNDAAINALTINATDTFDVTVSDGSGSTATQTLTVNLTAANDAPVVVLDQNSLTYVDNGTSTYSNATGTFGSSDRDTIADTVTFSISGQSADASVSGFDFSLVGTYGKLFLNSSTGAYQFVPNGAAIDGLSAGQSLSDDFIIQSTDSSSASSNATFKVNAVGANSTPQILGGAAAKALTETNSGLTTTGSLSVVDIDTADTITVTRSVLASGTRGAFSTTDPALLSMLTLSRDNNTFAATAIPTSGTQERALYWKFDSGSEAFNHLANGESLVLTYTLTAADNAATPLSDTETVTITITGTNDAPLISLAAGDANSASLTENGANPLVASDTLTVSDVDTSDVVTAAVVLTSSNTGTSSRTDPAAPTDSELLSMLTVTQTTVLDTNTSSALLTWNFNAGAEAFDYLADGETLILTYSVTATDDNGIPLSGSETVTITITGANDAPVLSATRTIATYTDTAADDTFNTVSGQLSSTDADTKDGATFGISGADITPVARAGFDVSKTNTYGTLFLNSVNGSYLFVPNDSAIEGLTADAAPSFTFTVNDGLTTVSSQSLTVNLIAANDTPTVSVGTPTATLVEAGGVANGTAGVASSIITLTKADRDGTASFDLVWLAANGWSTADTNLTFTKLGTYGTATLTVATGVVSYALNNSDADTEGLKTGDVVTETFAVRVTDGASTADANAVFTIHGSDDAPTLDAITALTYQDTAANDDFNTMVSSTGSASGTLSSSTDVDGTAGRVFAIFGQSPDASLEDFTHSKVGTFGTLYLNSTSGAYLFKPSDAAMESATAAVAENFTLSVTDSTGLQASQTLTVNVNGVNDTPTVVAIAPQIGLPPGTVYETDSGLITTGRLVVGDVDAGQTVNINKTSGTLQLNTGTITAMDTSGSGVEFAWLTLSASTLTSTSEGLVWTFNSDSQAFDYLRSGDTYKLVYTVTVSDGVTSTTTPVTVNILGTNDAPLISIDSTGTADTIAASFTETNDASRTATGTLTVSDREASDTLTASVAAVTVHTSSTANSGAIPSDVALLAMMTVSPTSLLADSTDTTAVHGLTWTFNSSANQAFNSLALNETLVLDYTLRVVDTANGQDTQTVRITITGTNDVPTVTATDVSGSIASGFPTQLFDSGSISFVDLDVADLPTATVTSSNITGTVRNGAAGSLTLSANQLTAIGNAFSLTPATSNANTGVVNWNFNINQSDIDFLGSGQTVTAVFTVTVNDAKGGAVDQNVTITISGKNNAPVISVDAGDSAAQSLTEANAALSISDTLTVTDTNLTDTVTAQVLSATVKRNNEATVSMVSGDARLDWLTVSPSNVLSGSSRTAAAGPLTWTFNSDTQAFNELAAGETLVFTYTIQVGDDAPSGSALTDTQTVTLTITGTNDAPVISLGADDGKTATLTETNAGLNASDSLTVSDLDTANSVSVSRTLSATGNTSDPAAPSSAQLLAMLKLSANNSTWTDGPLTLIGSTGTTAPLYWQFDSGNEAFNYLASGESLVLTYTITATDDDGTPLSDTETITVTINGSNDAPVISSGPDSEDLTETNSGLSTIGSLTVSDLDTSDVVTATRSLVVTGSSDRTDPNAPSDASLLAMFGVNPSAILDATQTSAVLNWAFNSGGQNFDYLAEGENLVLTFTVTATDDNGTALADSETVTITIIGSNDAPVISMVSQDSDSASLTEVNDSLSATGTLTVSDVDRTNTVNPSVVSVAVTGVTSGLMSNNAALLQMLNVDSTNVIGATATSGVVTWIFNSANEHFNHLAHGEQLVLTYTVRASDSASGVTDKTIVITITGSNDQPTVSIAPPASFVEAADASVQSLSATGSVLFVELDQTDLIDVTIQAAQAPAWSGGALPLTLAQSLANGFSVSATNVSVGTPVNWTYSHAASNFDFLGEGETITFSYDVVVTDVLGQSSSARVEFRLTGTNDAPSVQALDPILLTDTAEDDRLSSITGSLRSADADVNDTAVFSVSGAIEDSSRSAYDRKLVGAYGSLFLSSSTGAYEFVPDDVAINGLTENASEIFTLTVTDGSNASASRVLTVQIAAANDRPELIADVPTVSYIDGPGDDNFVPTYGQLTGFDRDIGAHLGYNLQGSVADSYLSGFDTSKAGNFGTLYLNTNTGAYVYVPSDEAIEGQPENTQAEDAFVFEVNDGFANRSANFIVTVVGAGDPPVFSEGNDAVSLQEVNASLTASGFLTVTDSDLSDSVNLVASVAVSGTTVAPVLPDNASLLAMLSLSPTQLLSDASSISESVSWRFNSGSEYFDSLAAGETLVLTYTISATDSGTPPLSSTTTVTVTILGTNDGPVLDVPQIISLSDTAGDDSLLPVAGQLSAIDSDHNAVLVYSVAQQVADSSRTGFNVSQPGQFGRLYLNTVSGAYEYVPNKLVIEALKEDRLEAFTVRVSDGTSQATQTLVVDIVATNDTPVLGAVTDIAYDDTSANDNFSAVIGTLTSSDRDGDVISYAINGQVVDSHVIDSVSYNVKREGLYGTLYLNAQSGAYRFVPNDLAIESLKTNASEVFGVVASDASAADTGVLTVNITATNDTPSLSASVTTIGLVDTADFDRLVPVSGVLTSMDRDAPESAVYSVVGATADGTLGGYDFSKTGTYGRLHINSTTGAYEFVPNDAAVNSRVTDDSETFTLRVTDGSSATASEVLTVNVTAANDKPTLTASLLSTTYVDTSASDTFTAVSGTLTGSDADTGAALIYGVQDGVLESNTIGDVDYDVKLIGSYGTLYLASVTGQYTYVPDDVALNGLSVNAREEFMLQVNDGALSQNTLLTVWLVGASDQPVISDGIDRVALIESNAALTASGSITVTDNDPSDQVHMTHTVSVESISAGTPPDNAELLSMLTLSPTTVLVDGAITAQVGWSFNSGAQNFDYLAAGETAVLTYILVATDTGSPALTDNTTLVITITGTNDAPVLVVPNVINLVDTAIQDTWVHTAGQLIASDADHNAVMVYSLPGQVADISRTGFDVSKTGSLGKLFLNSSSGAYQFVPDGGAIEALKLDTHENFSVRVSDGELSATQTFRVEVTAANDTPTLSASAVSISYDDSATTDRFLSVRGVLSSLDRDAGDSATYGVVGGQADTSQAGFNFSRTASYGKFYVHSQTGAYQYVPSDEAINALTTVATDSFEMRVTDGSGATAGQTLTVTINGTNDVPVVTNSPAATQGSVTEAGHLDDGTATAGTPTATGSLSVSDLDAAATRSWSLQGTPSATYGTMVLDTTTGQWTYTLNNSLASTQALREGEVVSQTYVARATDNLGAYVDQTLTVTINGTNDVPVISSSPAQALGIVRESGHFDDGGLDLGTPSVSGQITASDVDRDAMRLYEFEGEVSERYGRIALNRETGEWTYTLDNTLVTTQNLREGQTVQQTYTVRVTDDRDAQVRETLTITIEGSNDVPVVVDALEATAYLQGEQMEVSTAQLFTDIDVGAGDFSYSAQLPPGMRINAQSGVILGAGTRPGDYDIVVRATDAQGAWAEARWAVRINAPAQTDAPAGNTSGRPSGGDASTDVGGATTFGGSGSSSGSGGFDALTGGIPGFSSTIPVPSSGGSSATGGEGMGGASNFGVTAGNALGANGLGNNAAARGASSTAGDAGSMRSNEVAGNGTSIAEGATQTSNASAGAGADVANESPVTSAPDGQASGQERTDARVGADGQLQVGTVSGAAAQANTDVPALRAVERVNVAVSANGQISLRQDVPQPNETPTGIMLVEVSQQQNELQIEIADFRREQGSTYRATLLNGSPLPAWITVNPSTGKVSAIPTSDVKLIELQFIAEDAGGNLRTLEIKVDLSGQTSTSDASDLQTNEAIPRAAFMSQVVSHHQQWGGYGDELLAVFSE